VDIGSDANARQIALFHYNPDHEDKDIEDMLQQAKNFHPNVIGAWEGLEVTI
jgi:ribonuclease BN (tRNA processing enzyme)